MMTQRFALASMSPTYSLTDWIALQNSSELMAGGGAIYKGVHANLSEFFTSISPNFHRNWL
jgi:hypothetical protein